MRPLIGVTSLWNDEKARGWMITDYMDLIWDAGGVPVVLPLNASEEAVNEYVSHCAGFLFTGGQDVGVDRYRSEHPELCQPPAIVRDELEFALLAAARKAGRPVFGICRGLQLINAAMGGTLIEDIPQVTKSPVEHRYFPEDPVPTSHKVTIKADSALAAFFGAGDMTVNTRHHQAIGQLAPGLRVTAVSTEDGIIEAIEATEGSYLKAVQWHPEHIYKESAGHLAMVKDFVDSCRGS